VKVLLETLTWPEIEESLKKPHAVIVPTGSVEQHGPHLPLNVDFRCPSFIAETAATKVMETQDTQVFVAPAVNYGETSSSFSDFPGVIGFSIDTAMKVYEDIARSLVKNGFKNIIFVNGHSPNTGPITIALKKVSMEFPGAGLFAINWPTLAVNVINNLRISEWGLHAEEVETAAYMAIQPENVYMQRSVKEYPAFALSERWVKPDICADKSKLFFYTRKKFPIRSAGSSGVMGDPTAATKEEGEKILKAAVDSLVDLINEIVKSEP
jgi:creatinine amidohydrolase